MLLTSLKLGLIGFVLGTVVAAGTTWTLVTKYQKAKYEAKIGKANELADVVLKDAINRAIRAERDHHALATTLEVQHENHRQELDQVLIDNQRLVRELGGLRDPGRQVHCGSTVPTGTKPSVDFTDTTSNPFLSEAATEFLLEFARRADRAAEYAETCHAWVQGLNQGMAETGRNMVSGSF